MNLKQLIRLGIVIAAWVGVTVLMTIFGIINLFFAMPAWLSWLFIGLGFAATMLVLNPKSWAVIHDNAAIEIEHKIEEELAKMSEKDVLEAQKGIREIKAKLGIDIYLPLGDGKLKRQEIDNLMESLSEDELFDVKLKLRDGELDDDSLAEWLKERRTAKS